MKDLLKIFLLVAEGIFYAGTFHGQHLQAADFVIPYSNDVVGSLENCGCDELQLGGLARKATILNKLPEERRASRYDH